MNNGRFTSDRIKEMWKNPEYRKHISECVSKNMKGKKKSKEHVEKMRLNKIGTKASLETRKKMSMSSKGRIFTKEHLENMSKARRGKLMCEHNKNWKGEEANITVKHNWIRHHWGSANKCEMPGCVYPRMGEKKMLLRPARYEWSNKSGKYLRDRSDWWQLCKSCHLKFDYANKIHKK